MYFWEVPGVCPVNILSVIFFSVTLVDEMALNPVSCPAKVYFTAVSALRNDKFPGLGVSLAPDFSNMEL